MALLQIAEPGQSAAPHQHKRAVGIDLGTTNSLVAAVRSGQADTLCDEQGRDLLPSVVHYQAAGSQADAIRVGAIPEPASWAMMLAGFGLVGASMRRRKPVSAAA